MDYDETSDSYTCRNGKKLSFTYERRSKSKTGYTSEKKVFINAAIRGAGYCVRAQPQDMVWEEGIL